MIDRLTPLPYADSFGTSRPPPPTRSRSTILTDELDVAKNDLATFGLGPITFGTKFEPVPPVLTRFWTEVDLRPRRNILVGSTPRSTPAGDRHVEVPTLDPATRQDPEKPDQGFLPPNVTSPTAKKPSSAVNLKPAGVDTTVCNDARIVFDLNAPIDTLEFSDTISAESRRVTRGATRSAAREPPMEPDDCGTASTMTARVDRLRGPELLQRERSGVEPEARAHEAAKAMARLLLKGALAGTTST